MSGTGKAFWDCYAFKRLFLRTNSYFSARIPLPPQCAHWGTFSPGEGFAPAALATVNDNFSYISDANKILPLQAETWYNQEKSSSGRFP